MNKALTICTFLILLSGCSTISQNETENPNTKATQEISTTEETSEETSEETNDNSQTITFGETITSDSDSVTIDDNQVTITSGGEYTLTGTSEDANIEFNLAEDDDLFLNLDNLNLTATSNAAIYVAEGHDLTINLIGESTLSDGTNNSEMQAPIFIDEVNTTIQGEGTLNLFGNSEEGFEINNELTIESGTLNITAADDGINAGDGLVINGGIVNIDSEGDGLDSNGYMELNGGTMIVSAGNNANGPIDIGDTTEDYFTLNGGTIIATGGDMGVTPSDSSQNYMASSTSGESITIDGQTYEPKAFSYFFISTPELNENSSISVDDSALTMELNTQASSSIGGDKQARGEEMMMQ